MHFPVIHNPFSGFMHHGQPDPYYAPPPPPQPGISYRSSPFSLFHKVHTGKKILDSIPDTPPEEITKPSTAIKLLKFTSCCGAVISLGILIAGLALSIIGMSILGGVFLFNSLVSLFYSYKLGQLKSIDQYTQEMNRLNADLGQKNGQIQALTAAMQKTAEEFTNLENQFTHSIHQSEADQKQLSEELVRSQRKLQKNISEIVQSSRRDQKELRNNMEYFRNEEAYLKEELDRSLHHIDQLEALLRQCKMENKTLKRELDGIDHRRTRR